MYVLSGTFLSPATKVCLHLLCSSGLTASKEEHSLFPRLALPPVLITIPPACMLPRILLFKFSFLSPRLSLCRFFHLYIPTTLPHPSPGPAPTAFPTLGCHCTSRLSLAPARLTHHSELCICVPSQFYAH